jgi:hypothetical protein
MLVSCQADHGQPHEGRFSEVEAENAIFAKPSRQTPLSLVRRKGTPILVGERHVGMVMDHLNWLFNVRPDEVRAQDCVAINDAPPGRFESSNIELTLQSPGELADVHSGGRFGQRVK